MTAQPTAAAYRPLNIVTLLGRLEKSGLNRETAEIFVETVVEVQEHNAATKLDLKETEARLQIKIAEIHQKIAETKTDLIKFMLINTGVTITVLGSFIAILGFFLKSA